MKKDKVEAGATVSLTAAKEKRVDAAVAAVFWMVPNDIFQLKEEKKKC